MKKLFLLISILCIGYNVNAQMRERRVYYLDVTHSMVNPNDIWGEVRDNLKEAISNVNDETTELIIIPFTDGHHSLTPFKRLANENGKKELITYINNLTTVKNCYTHQNQPFQHFLNNYPDNKNLITYFFVMTDGACHSQVKDKFKSLLNSWSKKNTNIYGFYVMLHKSAVDATISNIITDKEEQQLYLVETADMNINIIRIDNKATFNIRNDEYVDIPIYSTLGKVNADFIVTIDDKDYQIDKYKVKDNHLRVYLSSNKEQSKLPTSKNIKLYIQAKAGDKFTKVVTKQVILTCLNEKEYTLKITVK